MTAECQDVTYHVAGPVVRRFPILDPRHTAQQFCVRCGLLLRDHCWPGYPEGAVIAIGRNWQAMYIGPVEPNCDQPTQQPSRHEEEVSTP